MAGLVPAIHVFLKVKESKTWMPAQASLRSLRKLDCEREHDGRRIGQCNGRAHRSHARMRGCYALEAC
jgi:hypothetical protein